MYGELLNVALVDDDPDDHFLVSEALKFLPGTNFKLSHFYSATELFHYLSAGRVKGSMPDLIILDVSMPEINGLECIRRLKEEQRTRAIPVFVLSTTADIVTQEQCLKLGATGYFIKPPTVRELSKILEKIVTSKAPRQGDDRR